MRSTFPWFIALALFAFLGVGLYGYHTYQQSLTARAPDRRDTLSDIKYWGSMTVGIHAARPPMGFLREGKPVGFDADVATAIGTYIGVSTNVLPFSGENADTMLQTALLEKKIDMIISAAPATTVKRNTIPVSDPYPAEENAHYVIGFRKEDNSLKDEVNLALASLRQNGKLETLRQQWFTQTP